MAVYPFFPADDSGLRPTDALTDASTALSTLAFLLATSEPNLGEQHRHGLGVMMEAIANVMMTAADEVAVAQKDMRDDHAGSYERGYQNGLADGRLQVCRANVAAGTEASGEVEGLYRAGYVDGAKAGWAGGWYAGRGKVERFDPAMRDEDIQALLSPLPGGQGGARSDEGSTEPVPRLTEEAPVKGNDQSQASA